MFWILQYLQLYLVNRYIHVSFKHQVSQKMYQHSINNRTMGFLFNFQNFFILDKAYPNLDFEINIVEIH